MAEQIIKQMTTRQLVEGLIKGDLDHPICIKDIETNETMKVVSLWNLKEEGCDPQLCINCIKV